MNIRKSDLTKKNILEAAENEFSEKGLYGARVDEIALKANINKRMIYQYFGNKEELYKEVLEVVYNRLGECEDIVISKNANWIDKISELVRVYFAFLKNNSAYVRMLMWENLNYGKYFEEKCLGHSKDNIRKELERIIILGKELGDINDSIEPDQVFQTLIACSFNYFSNMYTLSRIMNEDLMSEAAMEKRINVVTDMIIEYVTKK